MTNILNIILSSAVIVSIISFYKWNQTKKLERITDKRGEWRNDLRQLAIDILDNNDLNEDRILLSKLKLRINTKGFGLIWAKQKTKDEQNSYFLHDGYMWEIIDHIEKTNNTEKRNSYKLLLINAISLLIKYDWDRSKNEITSNEVRRANRATYFILILFFLIYLYSVIINVINNETILLPILLLFLLPFMIPSIILVLNTRYERILDINKLLTLFIGFGVFLIIEIVLMLYFDLFSNFAVLSLFILSCCIYITHFLSLQIFADTRTYTYTSIVINIMDKLQTIEASIHE